MKKSLSRHQALFRAVILTVCCLFCYSMTFAQVKVSGTVTSSLGPEPGVAVIVKGQKTGTTTDLDGKYSLSVPSANSTLVFSLMGFQTMEVEVAGRSVIDVAMTEDATLLDDVVVIGYGAQKKQFVIGSVSQVNSSELLKAPAPDVKGMLSGRLAGVTTVQTTGTPGQTDNTTMLVRGLSTFNGAGPLFLVDGVERQIDFLNPNDIATISILKDAATAAIYGVRAANGVVMITTKSGSQGKATIAYDGSVTFDTNACMPEMLNAEEYVYWHNKAREMDGFAPWWTEDRIQQMKELGIWADIDWQKQIYKPFGLTHQHNVSVSGGTDKVKYYASMGVMDQDGILKRTDYTRYNFRANFDAQITKNIRFNVNASGSFSDRHWPGLNMGAQSEFSPISQALYNLPCLAGEYNGLPLGYYTGTYVMDPVASLNTGFQRQRRSMVEIRSTLEYDFHSIKALDGLKASIFFAYNFGHTLDNGCLELYQVYGFDPSNGFLKLFNSDGISETNYTKSHSMGWDMTIRPQINYERDFGKHHVSGLFLFERYKHYGDTMTGYKKGYYTIDPIDISLGTTNQTPYVSGSYDYKGSASFAFRAGYAYDKKYLAEFTLRADGSYKFAPKNRWGYFPSIALGWVISEEGFFKGAVPQINFLKLRGSFGQLGSDDTDPYLYSQTYKSTGGFSSVIGGVARPSFYTTNYVHDNLTWSTTNTYDVGVELRAFRNRLNFEFDFFYKYTYNILESESNGSTYAPSLGGNNPTWLNSGIVDNRGLEINLGWTDAFSNGWSYSINGMVSWARNRVLKRKISDNHPSYRAILGQPMGSLYGFIAEGFFQTEDEINNYPKAPSGYLELGALKYKDINGDGSITEMYDYVKVGRSRIPEMTFSLNFDVAWKNLSLSMLLQGATLCNYMLNGVYNHGVTDSTMFTRAFYGNGNSVKYLVEDAWTPENTNAKFPRLGYNVNANNAWASTWWVRDGSYLRVKNVQLAYTLPASLLKAKTGIEQIKVFVAGTNLLTFSAFKYVDPENPGVNNGYYPQQRTYSIGLNLTF